MKRKITEKLLKWKNEFSYMPFMLVGARQVGKTYIVEEFCRDNFKNVISINLEKEENIQAIFMDSLNPEVIMDDISIIKGIQFNPDDTVIFIDEIQVSERAITSLKYFNESSIDYKIIVAGSLLGVVLNRFKSSFPVGKVHREILYPFDFEEYLWAIGEELLNDRITQCFETDQVMSESIHNKAINLYKDYLYVGGMPASILAYKKADQFLSRYDDAIKQSLLQDYLFDMSKYTTSSEHMKVEKIYNSIPSQLGRESNKFSYKLIADKGGKRTFESSIDWLIHSQLVNKCTLVEYPQIPLKAYEKTGYFKLYLNDTGLLCQLANIKPDDLLMNDHNLFRGMLTENYVAQMLIATGAKLNYWRSSNNAEIDFVINIKGNIVPVEVKAATNTKAKSLKVYVEKYEPIYSIKISQKNFGFHNKIKSVPLYAVHLING